jgi:Fe-S cluster assembly protein SufD
VSGPAGALLERLLPPGDGAAAARAWIDRHGLPTQRDEWWRYAEVAALTEGPWVAATRPPRAMPDRATIDRLTGAYGGSRLVFVDGAFAGELSDIAAAEGVSCTPRIGAAGEASWPSARYDGFQALNDVAGHEGAHVRVAAEARPDRPISVVHVSTGREGLALTSHPRTTIELEADAEAAVVETYLGLDGPHLANARTEIRVGPRGRLAHHKLLAGRPDAAHVAHTRIALAGDATVRTWSLLAGAAVARNTIDASLRGPGATVELEGLYLPVDDQRHDTAVTVEHATSGGTSRQHYRGVIDDRARGSFSGRIIVQPGTTATDAAQTSRSLVLTPTAEADTRPWLEIFADDVRCTHGAAVGRLDEDALFYLRSRGIPEAEARQLLVVAFVDELVSSIELPELRAVAEALIRRTDRP